MELRLKVGKVQLFKLAGSQLLLPNMRTLTFREIGEVRGVREE